MVFHSLLIEDKDITQVREFVAKWANDPFVLERQRRNLATEKHDVTRAVFWNVMVSTNDWMFGFWLVSCQRGDSARMHGGRSSSAWTHPSVLKFAGTSDPIQFVTDKARSLVLEATDRGWAGPPFDPIALCKVLKIDVVPREEIDDARTVPSGSDEIRIEFNPTRPRGRVRFSIAHEIAHTLFPDCREQIRNRVAREDMRGDEWQLEMLCNLAASEIVMPAGRFPALKAESLDVNHLMDLRKQYDVSTEALFLRTVRLTDADCLMFTASRSESQGRIGEYRIDYFIPSRNSSREITRGMLLPNNSAVSECTAVGFTAKGQEAWPETGDVRLECVGVPPFPGHSYPRVVGLIFPLEASLGRNFEIKYLRGDALQPRGNGLTIVGHVVNDRTPNWGGGFALAVRKRFEVVQKDFQDWIQVEQAKLELGEVRFATPTDHLTVASMVAQHGYGPSPTPRIRYNALSQCLEKLAQYAVRTGASVHLPRIGAGNANGDWSLIATLIDELVCSKKIDVTVYDLPDQPKPPEGLFGR